MKNTAILFFIIILLNSCTADNGNDADISSDKAIGTWRLISQEIGGVDTINDCTKQTTFIFESSRVLRQTFFRTENNNCVQGSEIISSWFALGNSSYRINGSNGSRLVIDLIFSEADSRYTTIETDVNNTQTISVFQKI